jgi:acyl-CoA reductase-like NAD-dependent aldehyde dehydrogenase
MHAGQACILHSRQLVHRSRYDEFVELFSDRVKATRVGDPRDSANEMGPLINAESRDRVQGMVDRAVAQGARLVTGGGRPADQPTGFYFEPTVLADVDNGWEIAQEEVFGPVTAIIAFDTDDEAVALANDSRYGLVGTVHAGDRERAKAVARRVDAGCVSLNGGPPYGLFGGTKQSGIGREGGIVGIQSFTEVKSVSWFG